MESEVSACSSCGRALPAGAELCDTCGEVQALDPTRAPLGNVGPLLAAGMLTVVGLAGWFAYASLSSDPPVLIGVQGLQELQDDDFADLYTVDDVLETAEPDRDDPILRDVRVIGGGSSFDGYETVSHGPFGFEHDGGTLFSYQEGHDDDWIVALLDEGKVVELDAFPGVPVAVRTTSGTYISSRSSAGCSIVRLEGRSTEPVARADTCLVVGSADLALLTDERPSGIELSIVELSTGVETMIDELEQGWNQARFSFSPDGRNLMVASTDPDLAHTLLVELETGEVLVEEGVTGVGATVGGFLAAELDPGIPTETVVAHYTSEGERQQVMGNSGDVEAVLNHRGTAVAFLETRGDDRVLSIAPIERAGAGPIVEIGDLGQNSAMRWTPGSRLLTIDQDGVIAVVEGDGSIEIGELGSMADSVAPQLVPTGPSAWLVSGGGRAGVVLENPDPSFVEIDELESVDFGTVSEDERWLVVVGRGTGSRRLVILFETNTGRWATVDEIDADDLIDLGAHDGHAYYRFAKGDQRAARRVSLALDSQPEDMAEDVLLFLPNRLPPFVSHRDFNLDLTTR